MKPINISGAASEVLARVAAIATIAFVIMGAATASALAGPADAGGDQIELQEAGIPVYGPWGYNFWNPGYPGYPRYPGWGIGPGQHGGWRGHGHHMQPQPPTGSAS